MNKTRLQKSECLVAAAIMLLGSQTVLAEAKWGISGWLNEGITYYDDGDGSDAAQLSDNGTTLGSRITLSGSYKPPETNLNAGFEVIVEPFSGTPNFAGGGQTTPLLFANQDNLDTFNGGDIGLLGSSIHVGGSWGKITVGLQSMPTDNIAVLADPSGTIWSGISPVFRGNGFFIRGVGAGASNATWGDFVQCLTTPGLGIGIDCNGIYRNGVRYDLPAFGPVSVAVGIANDEIYDVAVKYSGQLSGMTANLHFGYAINQDGGTNVGGSSADVFQVQGGLMDPGSGLFGVVAYQIENADNATSGSGDDTDAYYLKGGIKKKWLDYGESAIYGEFGMYNDQYGSGNVDGITGSEVQRFGIGVEQSFGGQLLLYGKWEQLSLDVDGSAAAVALYDGAEDLDLFTVGLTYHF
ncbi:MAG: porin [Candidatus Thiodiazotropha sp. (ex Lucinoma borealis)]|nr:porin [Candidatus Thiodiazotropha sp. (ex Lucinoma borealis)]MCU7838858.1 porin [Candidatus Thiodiazotropha sp. (ex Troendleina suluensis)]MCU7869355.1 porin [Candidatus Thiodiazotropha sp. (ex Lucinoma borealis)]MCU7873137.1 porin [Candidatus Thiodiazotropha sp. (ex Lucinoma borealis)]MCU7945634.1 porin [Candidatus Thiodiazotropha sp. (ex Cardiolucina cf. quadrata)]